MEAACDATLKMMCDGAKERAQRDRDILEKNGRRSFRMFK